MSRRLTRDNASHHAPRHNPMPSLLISIFHADTLHPIMRKFIIILLVALLSQVGCGAKKVTTNIIGKIGTKGMVAAEVEVDVDLARQSTPSLIKVLEVLSYGNPHDRDTLVLLSKGYGQYAFGFYEEDLLAASKSDEGRKKIAWKTELFYERGKDFGIRAIQTFGPMKKAMNAPFPEFKKALARLGNKSVPALFWTAFSWAGWLNLNADDPSAIIALPKIEALAHRAIELDDDFYFGSAHALLAVLQSSRPAMLGGSDAIAKEEFAKAFAIAPNYLMSKVLFAQYYCRRINDPHFFESTLNDIIFSDPSLLPNARLANELAIRRAKLLLGKKGELF